MEKMWQICCKLFAAKHGAIQKYYDLEKVNYTIFEIYMYIFYNYFLQAENVYKSRYEIARKLIKQYIFDRVTEGKETDLLGT